MALPVNYTYKIVGVTFENDNGTDRQQLLKKIYNRAVKELKADPWLDVDYNVSFRSYEFDGSPALAVLVDGYEIGNIAADSVNDVSEILAKKDPYIEAEIRLNNCLPEDYIEMMSDKRSWSSELAEIEDTPIYSGILNLIVDERPAPAPEPPVAPASEPKKKKRGLFGRLKK